VSAFVPPNNQAANNAAPGRDFESGMGAAYRNNPFSDSSSVSISPQQPQPQQQPQQPQQQSTPSVYPQSPFSNPYSK
jgi:hypothetical protein